MKFLRQLARFMRWLVITLVASVILTFVVGFAYYIIIGSSPVLENVEPATQVQITDTPIRVSLTDKTPATQTPPTEPPAQTEVSIWQPLPGTSWHWQLQGSVNPPAGIDVLGVDLFDNSASRIAGWQDDGYHVICYFSTAFEGWRPDAGDFPEQHLGNQLDDWEDEKWVDFRTEEIRTILVNRLDLAAEKGCDGIDPDNVDVYLYYELYGIDEVGISPAITRQDTVEFLTWLADEAHDRGLSIGLKNAVELVPQLEPHFDFAVNESCMLYNECADLLPFIESGKAVFHMEYETAPQDFCDYTTSLGFTSAHAPYALDGRGMTYCWDLELGQATSEPTTVTTPESILGTANSVEELFSVIGVPNPAFTLSVTMQSWETYPSGARIETTLTLVDVWINKDGATPLHFDQANGNYRQLDRRFLEAFGIWPAPGLELVSPPSDPLAGIILVPAMGETTGGGYVNGIVIVTVTQ